MHFRQGTQKTGNTYNTDDRRLAQLTDQAPETIERAAQEPRRITPARTAAVHACRTATSCHYFQQGQRQILSANASQCEAQVGWAALQHGHYTDIIYIYICTTRTSGGHAAPPAWGPIIRRN